MAHLSHAYKENPGSKPVISQYHWVSQISKETFQKELEQLI